MDASFDPPTQFSYFFFLAAFSFPSRDTVVFPSVKRFADKPSRTPGLFHMFASISRAVVDSMIGCVGGIGEYSVEFEVFKMYSQAKH
jgi:hypothetical protein